MPRSVGRRPCKETGGHRQSAKQSRQGRGVGTQEMSERLRIMVERKFFHHRGITAGRFIVLTSEASAV